MCGRARHNFYLWSLGTIFYSSGCISSFFWLSLAFVDCVPGVWIRGRAEGKVWGGTVSGLLHVIALCIGTEPQERGKHRDHSHSPPQHRAPLLTVGTNPAANGLGSIREEGGGCRSPPTPVVWLQKLRNFIDGPFFDEWLDLLCFSLYAWLAHSVK